jgi:hypothetical protein
VTIGIGAICDHGRYMVIASDRRASYGNKRKNARAIDPNDDAGKTFDFHPQRLVASVAGKLGVLHDLVGELTIELEKLLPLGEMGEPIRREHIENAIDNARFRQMKRRYNWASRSNYGITLQQLLQGKLPYGKLDSVVWAEAKQTVFAQPFLAEVIVGGYLDDEPVMFKASGKRHIEGDSDPPVFVIGSSGSRYAMEHLNRRGQNVFSSFAQTVLHIHEALEIARVKDEDGQIGDCSGYIVMCRDRQGFEQIPHNCDRLREWATLYKSRESTTSLKQGFAVKQAECLLTSLAPGLRFDKRVKSNTPKRSTPLKHAALKKADRASRDGPP